MEYYILKYTPIPTYLEERGKYREEHLKLAKDYAERGLLILGGALSDPADEAILVFKADSEKVVAQFATKDPYVQNGLIAKTEIRKWKVVIGSCFKD
ncbi:YciI-like protein [Salegentibacter sp. HM20]